MRCFLLPLVLLAAPAVAQDHSTMDHGAMDHGAMDHAAMGHGDMQASEPVDDHQSHQTTDHAAMDHPVIDHATMDHSPMDHAAPSAEGEPPHRALSGPRHAADAVWGADSMDPSREALAKGSGAMQTGSFMLERLEARLGDGREAYLWDAQGWYGGDIDKLWLKSEGEGEFGAAVESAEVQALWSHAIGPFFDLQAGARADIEPRSRAYAVLGVQGLAPYMVEVDAAAFLSDKGDLTARIEAEYDQRITQRLILQPRIEVQLAGQSVPELGIGSGLSAIEAGLRLRYEIRREFAPYIGVGYEAKVGKTADMARAAGDKTDRVAFLAGVRAWF